MIEKDAIAKTVQYNTLGPINFAKRTDIGSSSMTSSKIIAPSEFFQISVKYFASNLKTIQPIADLKIASMLFVFSFSDLNYLLNLIFCFSAVSSEPCNFFLNLHLDLQIKLCSRYGFVLKTENMTK